MRGKDCKLRGIKLENENDNSGEKTWENKNKLNLKKKGNKRETVTFL